MMKTTDKKNRVYEENTAVLRHRYPELYRILADKAASTVPSRVFRTKKGLPGIESLIKDATGERKIALHSKIDPLREAQRIADSVIEESTRVVVIIGFGLGYHVEEMLKQNEHTRFIVIEPERCFFIEALRVRDLRALLNSDRVLLFVETETVPYDALIPDIPAKAVKLYLFRPYALLFPEKTDALKKAFLEFRNKTVINTATLNKFDRLWTKNTFKNCEYFFTLNGVDTLHDSLKGLGALVLAAGPSLDRNIGKIKKLQEVLFIIASDSALLPLLRHGIVPDFVVTVDPQFINSFKVAAPPPCTECNENAILIADPAVYPSTLRNYRGTRVITSSVFSPGQIVEQYSGKKGSIAAGGSVATAAFDFARITGADPIIIAGLDLSYPKGKTHLSGSFIEDFILSRTTRFKPVASFYAEYIRSGKPSTVTDRKGRTVFTDKKLLLYKSWFDNLSFSKDTFPKDTSILNATEDGLSIRSIKDIEFRSINQFLSARSEIKQSRKKSIHNRLKPLKISPSDISGFVSYLDATKKNLHTLHNLTREARTVVEQMLEKKIVHSFGEKKLASFDAAILSYWSENRLVSMVLQSPIHTILGSNADEKEEGLRNSHTLYSAMEEASRMLIDLLSLAERKISKYAR